MTLREAPWYQGAEAMGEAVAKAVIERIEELAGRGVWVAGRKVLYIAEEDWQELRKEVGLE